MDIINNNFNSNLYYNNFSIFTKVEKLNNTTNLHIIGNLYENSHIDLINILKLVYNSSLKLNNIFIVINPNNNLDKNFDEDNFDDNNDYYNNIDDNNYISNFFFDFKIEGKTLPILKKNFFLSFEKLSYIITLLCIKKKTDNLFMKLPNFISPYYYFIKKNLLFIDFHLPDSKSIMYYLYKLNFDNNYMTTTTTTLKNIINNFNNNNIKSIYITKSFVDNDIINLFFNFIKNDNGTLEKIKLGDDFFTDNYFNKFGLLIKNIIENNFNNLYSNNYPLSNLMEIKIITQRNYKYNKYKYLNSIYLLLYWISQFKNIKIIKIFKKILSFNLDYKNNLNLKIYNFFDDDDYYNDNNKKFNIIYFIKNKIYFMTKILNHNLNYIKLNIDINNSNIFLYDLLNNNDIIYLKNINNFYLKNSLNSNNIIMLLLKLMLDNNKNLNEFTFGLNKWNCDIEDILMDIILSSKNIKKISIFGSLDYKKHKKSIDIFIENIKKLGYIKLFYIPALDI